ncbi:MAG: hypothetical protein HY550_02020 [Elusimicrobia bacterium]|nr:hypothetical protein [Elusimicrobiota bacterium]
MEKALALDASRLGDGPPKIPAGYGAVMLGSEFCAGLLPSPEEAVSAAASFKGRLILATPMLTEAGLAAVKKILAALGGARGLEVIANDLGLLEYLRSGFRGRAAVSCGRILTHRVRIMPRDYAEKFLARYGIRTFEVDDAAVLKRLEPYGLALSWHYPFKYATVTRFCPWEERWASSCERSCLGRAERLRHPGLPVTLWRSGAAYFVRGQRSRKDLARNIYTPPFKNK